MNIKRSDIVSSNRSLFFETWKAWQAKLSYFSFFALPGVALLPLADTNAHEPAIDAGPATQTSNTNTDPRMRRPRRYFPFRENRHLLDYQKGGANIVAPVAGADDCPGRQIPAGAYTIASPYTDAGDTTGANNTVSASHYIHYVYYWHPTLGPDQVYSFTLTAYGANAKIEVSRTPGTFEPVIYILDGRFGCPTGTNNIAYNELVWTGTGSGTTGTLDRNYLSYVPLNVPLHLFVDAADTTSGPYTIRLQDVTVAPTTAVQDTDSDFDGDGKADLGAFRPSDEKWYVDRSSQGVTHVRFGLANDKIAPADYDGDNKTDFAVYRDGVWWWLNSSDSTVAAAQFGIAGDAPVPADFTADGLAELAVFRGGKWFIFDRSTSSTSLAHFGIQGDRPVVAEWDNDGRADLAVYRDGIWHLNRSTEGYISMHWGVASDIPVTGDYDGDGRGDLAIYRNGEWWIRQSLFGYYWGRKAYQWGLASDIPVPADYDGDGYTDPSVYRDGTWYIQLIRGSIVYRQFGLPGDKPVPSAYVP